MPRIAMRYVSAEKYEEAQDEARHIRREQQEAEAEQDEDGEEDEAPSAENITK